ncbi:unnamed protein product [Leuciscus chuanchicus]
MFESVTLLAGNERGSTDTNSPLTTIPRSTSSLAFSTLSKKTTKALFILEADKTPECPTTSPTAKQQSSMLTADVTFTACRLVSEHKPCTRWADMLPKKRTAHGPTTTLNTRTQTEKSSVERKKGEKTLTAFSTTQPRRSHLTPNTHTGKIKQNQFGNNGEMKGGGIELHYLFHTPSSITDTDYRLIRCHPTPR